MPPPSFFHCSFRTGATLAAPVSFLFVLNGSSTRRPRFFSFLFERGQRVLPRFFSFLFERGSTCCPRVFSFCFERGRHTPSPILFVPNRGSTRCPRFFSVSNGGSVYPTCRPLFLSVSTGEVRRPRFVFFTPQ
jgi:hypothetical protein